jgi:hypothetical protein
VERAIARRPVRADSDHDAGDAPGTLKPAETADVIAFLLSKASFPAGDAELPADAAALKEITFVAPQRD